MLFRPPKVEADHAKRASEGASDSGFVVGSQKHIIGPAPSTALLRRVVPLPRYRGAG